MGKEHGGRANRWHEQVPLHRGSDRGVGQLLRREVMEVKSIASFLGQVFSVREDLRHRPLLYIRRLSENPSLNGQEFVGNLGMRADMTLAKDMRFSWLPRDNEFPDLDGIQDSFVICQKDLNSGTRAGIAQIAFWMPLTEFAELISTPEVQKNKLRLILPLKENEYVQYLPNEAE